MKITYNVLWYDDHPDEINEDIKPWLRDFLNDLGFAGEASEFTLLEEYTPQPTRFWQRYDLIVTDLNLTNNGGDGRRLVDDVRTGHILTDVLIYSANAAMLSTAVKRDPVLERISIHYGRRDLESKLANLILITIRKAQTIPYIRGQFITQAIDLETQMQKLLKLALEQGKFSSLAESKTKLLADYQKRKAKFHENKRVAITGFSNDRVHELCDQDFVDAFDRQEFARHILKAAIKAIDGKLGNDDVDLQRLAAAEPSLLAKVAKELERFHEDVTKTRNTLAHVQEEMINDRIVIKGRLNDGSAVVIDDEWCKNQRAALRVHVHNLESILKILG